MSLSIVKNRPLRSRLIWRGLWGALTILVCLLPGDVWAQRWSNSYPFTGREGGGDVRVNDQGFIHLATSNPPPGDPTDPDDQWFLGSLVVGPDGFLWSFDAYGELSPTRVEAEGMGRGPEFGAYLAGTYAAGTVDARALAYRLDSNDAVVWARWYEGAGELEVRAAIGTMGEDLVLTGWKRPAAGEPRRIWIVSIDSFGEVEWEKALLTGTEDGEGLDVAEDEQREIHVVGRMGARGWMARLDQFGDVYDERTFDAGISLQSILVLPDLSVLAGGIAPGASGTDAWLVRLDETGDVLWERVWSLEGDLEVRDLLALPEGGFLAVGNAADAGTDRAWLLELDAEGNGVQAAATVGLAHTVNAAAIAPGGDLVAVGSVPGGSGPETWVIKATRSGGIAEDCDVFASVDPLTVSVGSRIEPTRSESMGLGLTVLDPPLDGDIGGGIEPEIECSAPCRPLACGAIEPTLGCEGVAQPYTVGYTGAEGGPVRVEWDTDDDGAFDDGGGNPRWLDLPEGFHTIAARVTDACADPGGPRSCQTSVQVEILPAGSALGGVSEVAEGDPPLRVLPAGGGLQVGEETLASAYNVYTNDLASWRRGEGPGPDPLCHRPPSPLPDGTVHIEADVPRGSWVLVTASNICAEGPAGPTSAGIPREDSGVLWPPGCGPLP